MYQSFTIGRKLVSKENTDRKLNNEVENAVMGVCMRKPKEEAKSKNKSLALHFTPKDGIFGVTNLQNRSNAYYSKFARETLDNDIEKELRFRFFN
jgi:hypothetical protein